MTGTSRARVGLTRNTNRRQAVYEALDLVRADLAAKITPQVLIKPNFLSGKNQLASSHVDAARGVLDFLLTLDNRPDEIVIAEGGNEDYSGQAFDNYGYRDLAAASPIPMRLIDLHGETEWVETDIILADQSPETVRMPKLVLDIGCKLSLAVAKTHDVCVVTLALKNLIMGTLYKPDRVKMHGYRTHAERKLPAEAQTINVNLIRVARHLCPDIAVIDGIQGLQGNGPGGDDGVDFQVAAASADVFAADAVITKTMGFEPLEMGLLHYANQLGLGIADLARIDVLGSPVQAVATQFKPHETTPLQMQWRVPALVPFLTA